MAMKMSSGGRGGGRGGDAVSDINITPLVDVMLVLLIIFMVTAPNIHHGTDLNTPDTTPSKAKTPPKDEEKATLNVDPKGKITLRKRVVDLAQLTQIIKDDPELQKSQELYINADPSLFYGQIMKIIGTVRRAGIKKVGIVVQPEDVQIGK